MNNIQNNSYYVYNFMQIYARDETHEIALSVFSRFDLVGGAVRKLA